MSTSPKDQSARLNMKQALDKIIKRFEAMSPAEFDALIGSVNVTDEDAKKYAQLEKAIIATVDKPSASERRDELAEAFSTDDICWCPGFTCSGCENMKKKVFLLGYDAAMKEMNDSHRYRKLLTENEALTKEIAECNERTNYLKEGLLIAEADGKYFELERNAVLAEAQILRDEVSKTSDDYEGIVDEFRKERDELLAEIAELKAENEEVAKLKAALGEFDNDDNWLTESEYADRPVKTGHTDWVYIGKWDPRVFSSHAIDGTPLPNTEKNERQSLSPFYNPDTKLTNLCKERDELREELKCARDALIELHGTDINDLRAEVERLNGQLETAVCDQCKADRGAWREQAEKLAAGVTKISEWTTGGRQDLRTYQKTLMLLAEFEAFRKERG